MHLSEPCLRGRAMIERRAKKQESARTTKRAVY